MSVTIDVEEWTPDKVLPIDEEFVDDHKRHTKHGQAIAARSRVVFAACARTVGPVLKANLWRVEEMGRQFRSWSAVVVENDSTDDTRETLDLWARSRDGHCHVIGTNNRRPHLHGFQPERMQALAEYRNQYLEFITENIAADYVVVLDLDVWGGYAGLMDSIGRLDSRVLDLAGVASTSVFQATVHTGDRMWLHYDQFAYRAAGWRNRMYQPYFPMWLPPPGSPMIDVYSAFGGMAVYRYHAIKGTRYASPDGDCEHVWLHRTMRARGLCMAHNPAQRVVVSWEPHNGRRHGND